MEEGGSGGGEASGAGAECEHVPGDSRRGQQSGGVELKCRSSTTAEPRHHEQCWRLRGGVWCFVPRRCCVTLRSSTRAGVLL